MSSQRLRLILFGSFGLMVVIFIAATFLGLSMLQKKSKSMTELKSQSKSLESQVTQLNIAKKDVDKYKFFNDVAKAVIPNDKDQVQAVAELFQMANESGILLQSVSFPASTLGTKASTPAAGSTTTNTTTSTTAPTPSTKDVISQAKPVAGISGLYSVELVIGPQTGDKVPVDKKVNYEKMLAFLSKIERNQRTAQVTKVDIQPPKADSTSSDFSFTFNVNIFIKP
jgi:hypothetical protein